MLSMDLDRTNMAKTSGTSPEEKPMPDPNAAEAIGRALEAHYADLIQAPLPDKFLDLLARLESRDHVSKSKGSQDALD